MKLEKGKTYRVVESLGMMILEGKYIGRAKRGGIDEVLVFESLNDKNSKFFGATWQLSSIFKASEEQPSTFLQSIFYANSIEELGIPKIQPYKLID